MSTSTPVRQTTVYEPGRARLQPLPAYLARLWAHRELGLALARSTHRAAQRATRLGPAWTVLNPVLLAGVYFLVFGIVLGGQRGTADYLTQLVGGVFLFYFTRDCVLGGSRAILRNQNLVSSTTIPRAVLPLAAVLSATRTLLAMLAVYAPLHLLTGQPVTAALLVMPLLLALHTMLNAGLALGLSALTVQVRDTAQALPYVLRLWLYLTPILYRLDQVTDRLPDGLAGLVHLNPLVGLFGAYHAVLLDGHLPAGADLAAATLWAAALLTAGGHHFRASEGRFALVS